MTPLVAHLIRQGHVAERGGAQRALKLRMCPAGCKAWVLVGLTGLVCAVEARVDPAPLSELGEAMAALEGRDTVTLRREGSRYVLDHRDAHDIAGTPAGAGDRQDVLRRHRCGDPPLAEPMTARSTFVEFAAAAALPDTEPEF